MTALVADRAGSDDLPTIAERIEVSQVDEIQQLEDWLTTRGEDVAGMHAGPWRRPRRHARDAHPTAARAARSARRSRASTASSSSAMIRHHEGAVVMVETLLTEGEGGQESEVFQLASHIASDQAVEIAAMQRELQEAE